MNIQTAFLSFAGRQHWRDWLDINHTSTSGVWLQIFKQKYKNEGLSLEEAVEEALCYGWIDGPLRRYDEKCYLLKFTPRTPNSIWGLHNILRVEKLTLEGRMTPAGQEKIDEAKANGQWKAALQREQVDILPKELMRALQKVGGGLKSYQAQPDARKKQWLYWLQSAKRTATRTKRIQAIVAEITGSPRK